MRFLSRFVPVVFQLSPLVLALMAVGVLGLGAGLQLVDDHRDAARLRALMAGGPPAVAVEAFDPARDAGAFGEVTVRARLDLAAASPAAGGLRVPLLPADGGRGAVAPAAALFEGVASADALLAVVRVEAAGARPLVLLNGTVDAGRGVLLPYRGGRAAALAPGGGDGAIFGLGIRISGALALLALLKLGIRGGRGLAGARSRAMPPPRGESVQSLSVTLAERMGEKLRERAEADARRHASAGPGRPPAAPGGRGQAVRRLGLPAMAGAAALLVWAGPGLARELSVAVGWMASAVEAAARGDDQARLLLLSVSATGLSLSRKLFLMRRAAGG